MISKRVPSASQDLKRPIAKPGMRLQTFLALLVLPRFQETFWYVSFDLGLIFQGAWSNFSSIDFRWLLGVFLKFFINRVKVFHILLRFAVILTHGMFSLKAYMLILRISLWRFSKMVPTLSQLHLPSPILHVFCDFLEYQESYLDVRWLPIILADLYVLKTTSVIRLP